MKKNLPCKECSKLIWNVSPKQQTGYCKRCWLKNRKISEKHKNNLSISAKKRWANTTLRKEQSEKRKEYLSNPENHWNWKGGKTPPSKRDRSRAGYWKFRCKMMEELGNICSACGSKDRLELDHIKQWAFYPELRFEPENCRILCHNCHKETDSYARQKLGVNQ